MNKNLPSGNIPIKTSEGIAGGIFLRFFYKSLS